MRATPSEASQRARRFSTEVFVRIDNFAPCIHEQFSIFH